MTRINHQGNCQPAPVGLELLLDEPREEEDDDRLDDDFRDDLDDEEEDGPRLDEDKPLEVGLLSDDCAAPELPEDPCADDPADEADAEEREDEDEETAGRTS